MKIAWVCYYPGYLVPDRPKLQHDPAFHAVPWITLQAPLVAAHPDIELHIITIGKHYSGDDHFVHNNIHFHFLRLPRLPRALMLYQIDRRRIHACLHNIRPDLAQGFGTESSYGYAATSSPYPSLLMMQGSIFEIFKALGKTRWGYPELIVPLFLERRTVRACRYFICETAFSTGLVRRINPNAEIHQITTPVRPEFFEIQRQPPPADAPIILFVGSLIPAKGVEILLESFSELLRTFPQARLRLVGHSDPAYQAVLDAHIVRLDLKERVTQYGFCRIDALIQHFSVATLLVLPTLMDTAPNVIAEAKVAGVPVVASAVGGVLEMIESNVTGILVLPGSTDSLTAGLLDGLRDPDRMTAMAARAQLHAQRDHRPDVQVEKLIAVYRQINTTAGQSRRK